MSWKKHSRGRWYCSPAALLLLAASSAVWQPAAATASPVWQAGVERDIYAWAGPMAVAGLVDNWSGTLEQDDDGLLWFQDAVTLGYGPLQLQYLYRHHAEYEMSNQLAQGFYYEANDIELASNYSVTDTVRARHYEGEGLSLGWQLGSGRCWQLRPSVTWLRLYRLLWGSVSGTLNYTDADNWGGDLEVDYAYTEDKIPPARQLDQRSYGDLYSLDLTFDWQWQGYQMHYQGWNLLARIDWQDTPVTIGTKNWQFVDGEITANGDFPVYQREGEVFRTMRPPRFQRLQQALALSEAWDLTLLSTFNGIRNGHELGLAWQAGSVIWKAAVDVEHPALRLGLQHRWGKLSVLSDSLNINDSQLVALQGALSLRF